MSAKTFTKFDLLKKQVLITLERCEKKIQNCETTIQAIEEQLTPEEVE